MVARAHKDYVSSGDWRCPESPTGAHHWAGSDGTFVCRHCHSTKEAPLSLKDVTPWLLTKYLYRSYDYKTLLEEGS